MYKTYLMTRQGTNFQRLRRVKGLSSCGFYGLKNTHLPFSTESPSRLARKNFLLSECKQVDVTVLAFANYFHLFRIY